MRVLVLYAHPVENSFQEALHQTIVDRLGAAGHDVDDCDLYAEGFDPVMSRQERIDYHNLEVNQRPVADYVARLQAADAMVLLFPVWSYGFPAIMKGFFDRVYLPGVAFRMADGKVVTTLTNIRKLTAVVTYGGTRWRAWLLGDAPPKVVTRMLRAGIARGAPVRYLTHYDMNRSTAATRARFLARVASSFERF